MNIRTLLFALIMFATIYLVQNYLYPPQKEIAKKQEPAIEKPIKQEEIEKTDEQFYLLENEYMQLVFSNYGAALSEINLVIKSKEHPKSIINPIAFDKQIKEHSPQNDRFPLHSYYTYGSEPSSFEKRSDGVEGGYYPLLRRGIVGAKKSAPTHYACEIDTPTNELANLKYTVKSFTKDQIVFEASAQNRRIQKTFSFYKEFDAPYCFEMQVSVDGERKNLWVSSGVPEVELISGSYLPSLLYRISRGEKSQVETIKLKTPLFNNSTYPDWISNSSGFFGVIMDSLSEEKPGFRTKIIPGIDAPTRLTLIDPKYQPYPAKKYSGYEIFIPLQVNGSMSKYRFFAGPYQTHLFRDLDTLFSDPSAGYFPDYESAQNIQGTFSFISDPFAKFLFFLMQLFKKISRSWGLSIILLTIALRIMLYPLNSWSTKSQARMQDFAPKAQAIKAKYKNDPKRANLEMMKMSKEAGFNPLTGCLPIIIQIPFLMGMFHLLKTSFDLRGASFIPGWIDNLTAPDVLFSWSYPIFFIGTQLHLLPLLLGAATYIQQKIQTKSTPQNGPLTDKEKQAKMMTKMIPIVFTVLFYNFPSGLNLYWLSSTLFGIAQTWYTTKWMKKKKV